MLPRHWAESVRLLKSTGPRLELLEKQSVLLSTLVARNLHPDLLPPPTGTDPFNRHEFKVYSQNGEDGLLLHIFSSIGAQSRFFVEFGCGIGSECNTANLSVNFGWRGLLLDADDGRLAQARAFYHRTLSPCSDSVRIEHAMITAENINDLLHRHVPAREIDLLSIDIDGNDYWIWHAIDVIDPRVVVIEYNAIFGPHRSLTVEYDPEFIRWGKYPGGSYYGASLTALTRLARQKGYRLIGCDRHGVNAFFVRGSVDLFPAVEPEVAYRPNNDRSLGLLTGDRFAEIQHLSFVEV